MKKVVKAWVVCYPEAFLLQNPLKYSDLFFTKKEAIEETKGNIVFGFKRIIIPLTITYSLPTPKHPKK